MPGRVMNTSAFAVHHANQFVGLIMRIEKLAAVSRKDLDANRTLIEFESHPVMLVADDVTFTIAAHAQVIPRLQQ